MQQMECQNRRRSKSSHGGHFAFHAPAARASSPARAVIDLPTLLFAALAVATLALAYRAGQRSSRPTQAAATAEPPPAEAAEPVDPTTPVAADATTPPLSIHQHAEAVADTWHKAPDYETFRASEPFRAAVAQLAATDLAAAALAGFTRKSDHPLSLLALAVLEHRQPDLPAALRELVLELLEGGDDALREAALGVLARAPAAAAVAPEVLGTVAREAWRWDDTQARRRLRAFLEQRAAAGEAPTLGEAAAKLEPWERSNLATFCRRCLPEALAKPLVAELDQHKPADLEAAKKFLGKFARILEPVGDTLPDGSPLLSNPALDAAAARLELMLAGQDGPVRPPVLVGAEGLGKSALLYLLARRLQARGFTVFEASGHDIVSGQCYLGDVEKRVRRLLALLEGGGFVWLVPSLHDLIHAGRSRASETGVLEMLLPRLQAGTVRMLSELRPGAIDRLAAEVPRLGAVVDFVRLTEPGPAESLALAADWLRRHPGHHGAHLTADAGQLAEALRTADQFFGARALPGRLIDLLRHALQQAATRGPGEHPLDRPLLLATVAARTGMPLEVLDEARPLDLAALRDRFQQRVMGQPEAVETLVGRLAMIKAGLTDPTRPLGVFLFAGPTGTGKTEIAKTLARFLFGSEERMLRFDMSEFQSPASLRRLTGSAGDGAGRSLAALVRQQPFSLVLLDEFEKADSSAWDLFLQVFDDGRLTDEDGNLADLRHCIVILTSNLGAARAHGAPLGFGTTPGGGFRSEEVEAAISASFRPEFVNRLDRIVCFRPLSRDTMRAILTAQLGRTLHRRGLRQRPWTIDWDASATEFLLERGFSPTLGARPLQRALDRWFLVPFAEAIVNGELPAGEELIFVYASDGRLAWDLASHAPVPPDEPPAAAELPPTDDPRRNLRRIALVPAGRPEEVEFLRARARGLLARLELGEFAGRKRAALDALNAPGFWTDPGRFAVLGRAETIDRIENAAGAAAATLDRLAARPPAPAALRPLLPRLALRLHLLERASQDLAEGLPSASFLGVRPHDDRPKSLALARRLATMYEAWAHERGMHLTQLAHRHWHWLAAIDGFAACGILLEEAGIHVGEEGGLGETAAALVAAAPQPPEPNSLLPAPVAEVAAAALADPSRETVRRYQERPTPLVRDRRHDWRTGRVDLVLGGHFDLF